MTDTPPSAPGLYFTPRFLCLLFLYFSSGLPLALTGATLSYWLAESKVDIAAIGLFALVGLPYSLKFFWAPFLDSLPSPLSFLGRRRGWIITIQCVLISSLILLGLAPPDLNPILTGVAALFVAFASASQDIVVDAFRVEILGQEEQGEGAAIAQLGYRLGMIASGAGALYLATYFSWQATYFIMAGLICIGILATLASKEPVNSNLVHSYHTAGQWLKEYVFEPFADFTRRRDWVLILAFIALFSLADAFLGRMLNPFLYETGFSKTEVANIVKIYGTGATLLGTFIGGALVHRFGALRILFIAALLHALTNLMYALQAYAGHDMALLAAGTTLENITGGISSAAFVAYLSALTSRHYTATQYALLSALAALGRALLSGFAGEIVKRIGWLDFFVFSALLAIPGLLVLWILHKRLKATLPQAAET